MKLWSDFLGTKGTKIFINQLIKKAISLQYWQKIGKLEDDVNWLVLLKKFLQTIDWKREDDFTMNMTFDEKEEDNLSIAFGFSNLSFDDGNSTIFGSSERILNCTECLNELCIPESDYDVYRWKFQQHFTQSF